MSSHNTPALVLVVGMGISGQAVCDLLLRRGARVIANDMRPREAFNGSLDHLEHAGCVLRLGCHRLEDFLEADQIILSPGVPPEIEPIVEAKKRGIEVIGELEWAWRQVKKPVVAVTGTNGKTTTTSLIGEILKASGKRVFVGGNIGTPLSHWVSSGEDADLLVLEVSSFQLDTAREFCPDVGVLLNITEDHLDRYEGFQAYVDSKFSIFSRQDGRHTAILNLDDPICRSGSSRVPGRLLTYSRTDPGANARIDGGHAIVSIPGGEPFRVSLESCSLKGIHNEENILASLLVAASAGVSIQAMQEVVGSYRGLPHRVEWVGNWRGIDFYDDSKGTNVGAVIKAIENFDRPILLLLGGRDKLGSYAPLREAMERRGKAAFAFGEAAPRIRAELERGLSISSHADLTEAFGAAAAAAEPGDVVLLSPACSSFDQYVSYAQRGDHFKSLFARLTG